MINDDNVMHALNDECLVSWSKWSDKYFKNKCLYHVRWFDILCMISYKDDWNNDWNNRNDDLESYNNEFACSNLKI